MAVNRTAIPLGQAAPGHKPHRATLVEPQYGCAPAMKRGEDRIECGVVDIRKRGRAIETVGEPVYRRLLYCTARLFEPFAFGQFLKAANRANDTAGFVLQRFDIHQNRNSRRIGPFDDEFGAEYRLAGAHGAAHRRRSKWQRLAVSRVAGEDAAGLLARIAYPWSPTPNLGGAAVETHQGGFRRAHANARRNRVQRGLVNVNEGFQARESRDCLGGALTTRHSQSPGTPVTSI